MPAAALTAFRLAVSARDGLCAPITATFSTAEVVRAAGSLPARSVAGGFGPPVCSQGMNRVAGSSSRRLMYWMNEAAS